jgi:hypothetical protein
MGGKVGWNSNFNLFLINLLFGLLLLLVMTLALFEITNRLGKIIVIILPSFLIFSLIFLTFLFTTLNALIWLFIFIIIVVTSTTTSSVIVSSATIVTITTVSILAAQFLFTFFFVLLHYLFRNFVLSLYLFFIVFWFNPATRFIIKHVFDQDFES